MEKGKGKTATGVAAASLVIAMALALMAPAVAAQGCSMCYASAQQQQAEQARALNWGILILLVPSLLVFGGVMVAAARRKNAPAENEIEEVQTFRIELRS